MVDRSRTWSKVQRGLTLFLAPLVIVAAVVGGSIGADGFPEFAERYSIPGFTQSDDVVEPPSRIENLPSTSAAPDSTRSSNARRARPSTGATHLWQWSGASPGSVRTVTLAIDLQIYPVDGLQWFVNGSHDRNDIHGPLDAEFGLWHSSTRQLVAGDIVSACWVGRDQLERCPQIVIR